MVLEGETEVIFYRSMIDYIYATQVKNPAVPREHIEFILARGIGNISTRAVQSFRLRYPPSESRRNIVFCCFDTDVFENGNMPGLWTEKTRDRFLDAGAAEVFTIRACHMIEDWFFYDYRGILDYLGIEHPPARNPAQLPGSTAAKKLNGLYKLSHRIYQKGYATDSLVSHLDMARIYSQVGDEFKIFIREIMSNI
jgi:hypothetical protein